MKKPTSLQCQRGASPNGEVVALSRIDRKALILGPVPCGNRELLTFMFCVRGVKSLTLSAKSSSSASSLSGKSFTKKNEQVLAYHGSQGASLHIGMVPDSSPPTSTSETGSKADFGQRDILTCGYRGYSYENHYTSE